MLPHLSLPVFLFKKLFFRLSNFGAGLLCLPPVAAEGFLLDMTVIPEVLDSDSACSQPGKLVNWDCHYHCHYCLFVELRRQYCNSSHGLISLQ